MSCVQKQKKVEFFATYVADVMTSFVKPTQDLAWTACFFLSGDFLLELNQYHDKGGSWQVRHCTLAYSIRVGS